MASNFSFRPLSSPRWAATEVPAHLYRNVQYFKYIMDVVFFVQKAAEADTKF